MQRDGQILLAIYESGKLADYQIRALFGMGITKQRHRLRVLWQDEYVKRQQVQTHSGKSVLLYSLRQKGAGKVADLKSLPVDEFKWRVAERESLIQHDLLTTDFRITVLKALTKHPQFQLEEWITSDEFWAQPEDTVTYKDAAGNTLKRKVRPDGYFVIETRATHYRSRLLLEIDRATEYQERIVTDKVLRGLAYLNSPAYIKRSGGYKTGRWLIVTTSKARMLRMKERAEIVAGRAAQVFYYTTFDQVKPETVLTGEIWLRGGEAVPTALLPKNRP